MAAKLRNMNSKLNKNWATMNSITNDSEALVVAPLIVVVGETASGKTAVAIEIAKKINGEIICADSRTVYKHMNIGTAKPSEKEQLGVAHHMIDVVEPGEKFTVSNFKTLAEKCIQDIYSRGKVPVMVGGTGLYVDSVLYNFQFLNPVDGMVRQKLEQMSDEELTTLLYKKNIDTSNLNTKNRRHVMRAIETNGKKATRSKLRKNTIVLGIKLDREVLRQRITNRVEQMFRDGFMREVEEVSKKYGWEDEAMSGIGYRVAKTYFTGGASLEDVKKSFIKRDISLAKRQRTWFKRSDDIIWYEEPRLLSQKAIEFINHINEN